jgi:hypothetical protein
MGVDSFYQIGATHHYCQDYALTGTSKQADREIEIAVVCDGCSGSPNTDIGARLLAHALVEYMPGFRSSGGLRMTEDAERTLNETALRASHMFPYASIDRPNCLDATVVALINDSSEKVIRAWISGDGVIAFRNRKTREFDLLSVQFMMGAPAYASYSLHEGRRASYLAFSENGRRDVSFYGSESGQWNTVSMEVGTKPLAFEFDKNDYDLALACSDGAESFQMRDTKDPVVVHKVIDRLMDVKNPAGEFMIRRAKRFLTKECEEQGWIHTDDFSVAAIYLG